MRRFLVLGAVVGEDFWRIAYRQQNAKTGETSMLLSLAMHWDQLTNGEQVSFLGQPVNLAEGPDT